MDGMDLDAARVKLPGGQRILGAIKAALLLAVIFWIVIPSPPSPSGPGLDTSWSFGLNLGHLSKMIFGRDIIFTYGPLGYLAVPTFPEAEPWAVFAFEWGMALVTGYALWKLCRTAAHWTTAGLYLGVFWVASMFTFDLINERMLAAIIAMALVVATHADAGPWIDLGILFFCAGAALLIKFNVGVIGVGVALCLEAWLLWRHRSATARIWKPAAVALTVFPVTLVGLYWILDGTPWGIAAFLRNSAELATGYSEGMAWPGSLGVAVDALASLFVLLLVIPLLANETRRVLWAVPPAFVLSFLCFKSAMVREDAHALPFQFEIALAALLLVAFAPTPRNRILVGVFASASLALGIMTVKQMWPMFLPSDLDRVKGHAAVTNLNGYLHWKATVAAVEAATSQALTGDRLPAEFLPFVAGKRVNAYPWEIAAIRANHLRWQPLPVIQAYSAYTPALDSLNAHALEDAAGPEGILLAWGTIDGRALFYETPQSWRALLNWYDLQLTSPGVHLLGRRSTPRFGQPVPLGQSVEAHWDENILLPAANDDEALLMGADVGQSLKGMAKGALLRVPVIFVHVTLRSGHTISRRVLRSNLRSGVIVSEWPRCLNDIASMLSGGGSLAPEHVVSITFCTQAPSEFRPTIRIHWERMKLRHPEANH